MVNENEIARIRQMGGLDHLPANPWEFDVDLGHAADDLMKRVLTLIGHVAKFDSSCWPDDDYWRAALPDWMQATLADLTTEEADRLLRETPRDQWNTLPWEFGSWLDAMRDRGWRWWGYSQLDHSATIVVHIAMFPERIDAFRQILNAAGATIVAERYSGLE